MVAETFRKVLREVVQRAVTHLLMGLALLCFATLALIEAL
tara:strand:- start:940 stop:1059 length:120 start_codon:yes stop_codon:yes gene_type:complete